MGYHSQMDINLHIKPSLIKKFIALVKRKREEKSELARYYLEDLLIEEGQIRFIEYYNKWYGDGEFARFLAPYVQEGSLVFRGEDGINWGYWFDGKGNVQIIEFIERPTNQYFHRA